jgi:exonuclease SbcC
MITYDYTIDRKMGQGKSRIFVPDQIPTELNNIVLIEGPNSSGKSTLLNIFAIGLFGTKSTRVNPALQSKMQSLLDSSHQKLRFALDIASGDGNLILRSEKTDLEGDEITVRECTDGRTYRPISFENFEKKYNLIYDIPSNPTERLPELLKELKEEQLQFGNRFKEFGIFLRNMITQITTSRDPKRIEEVKRKLKESKDQRTKLTEEIPELQKFLELLEKSAYIQYYCYYSNEGERLTREKQKLEKTIKQFDKADRKTTSKLSRGRTRISNLQAEFTESYNKVTPLIEGILSRNERPRFKIWKDINPYSAETDDLKTVKIEAAHFAALFGEEVESMQKERSFRDASVWEKLFQALKEFEDYGLMIPQVELTIGEFVRILKEENKRSFVLIQRYQTLNQILALLDELRTNINELQATQKELTQESATSEQMSEGAVDTFYEQKRRLKKMESDLESLATRCNEYFQRCLSKNIDAEILENEPHRLIKEIPKNEQIRQYLSLGEKHVTDKIDEVQNDIVDKRGQLAGLNLVITQYEKDVQNLEKQKPHKFEAHLQQLNELLRKTDAMSQRLLSEYNINLKNLIDKKVKAEDISRDETKTKYYGEVSKYLAYRIGFFRHIDRSYKAKAVDLVSGIIVTDDGETIHITDMGTGQTQSAYILSLLNVRDDTRKIIALFDEIAMMDDSSIEPICSRLKELYKENRLLLGILVQKSNKINVKSLL